jgi:hypothetical protein
VAHGNPLSIGGNAPGPVTSWVVGVPLLAARDHRAPVVLVALAHLVALALVDRAVRGAFTPLERAGFVALYALLPWRVEASATLWNPNYLFLVGAVHLATARALARVPRSGATCAHVAALGLGAQLHPSVLLLGVHTLLLLARRRIRFSCAGAALGVALVLATLVPWLAAVAADPRLLGGASGFPFRGLLLVFPLLKGLALWLRYPSLALASASTRFDFTERLGAGVDAWLAPAAAGAVSVLGAVTVALALAANAAFFRGRARELFGRAPATFDPRRWLESYAALALAAAALVFAAAPTTPQSWQGIPLFHSALVPAALGLAHVAGRFGERRALAALAAAGALCLALDLALAAGAPSFRCTGRHAPTFPLRASSPMFEELGIQSACPWPLGVPGGWWPDVLPEE